MIKSYKFHKSKETNQSKLFRQIDVCSSFVKIRNQDYYLSEIKIGQRKNDKANNKFTVEFYLVKKF